MEKSNLEAFSTNLKIYLSRANTSATQMSEDLGIPKQTISNWSIGRSYPKIDTLNRIAEYLGCTISDLLETPNTSKQVESGRILSSIYSDERLMDCMTKIVSMNDSEREQVFKFVDFVNGAKCTQ